MDQSTRSARTSKSQSCHRCKAKKIGCDQTNSSCQNCRADGVECSRVTPQLRWSTKHEKFNRSIRGSTARRPRNDRSKQLSSERRITIPGPSRTQRSSQSFQEMRQHEDEGNSFGFELHQHDDDLSVQSIAHDFESNLTTETPDIELQMAESTTDIRDRTYDQVALAETGILGPITSPAGATGADSLLGTFYRLSLPTLVPQFSDHHLVMHYFSEVCSLYSCFDSHLNPFRRLVSEMWTSSATIYLTIQSMAIAHLSNHYLYMAPLGQIKRSQAWESLQLDLQLHRTRKVSLEKILISLLLLGLSTTWHQSSNLGLQYLFITRNLVQNYLREDKSTRPPSSELSDETFFLNSLMHWEMLATFVDPAPMMTFPGFGAPEPPLTLRQEPILPHPWTGISPELTFVLAEIGRLLRRKQRRASSWSDADTISKAKDDEGWAASLEHLLRGIIVPKQEDILDYNDDDTPKIHLICASEAYRYTGFLEIYQAFPRLLEDQISTGNLPTLSQRSWSMSTDHSCYSNHHHSWLSIIAVQSVNMIRKIAVSSAASRLQFLTIVSSASQLRLPDCSDTILEECHIMRQNEVVECREFVEERMLALSRKYPQNQMIQMLDVVKEVWYRLDNVSKGQHWLDIRHKKGWLTIVG